MKQWKKTALKSTFDKMVALYDTIAVTKDVRYHFLTELKAAIDACGGFLKIVDTIDVQLARK